ncbi:MAG: bacillithiol system redox-active protein YtxJ [Chryseobacterium sp.]|nr:bacillithiol system redox-active protein YtxJ [Chryseobacterium sp.]
MGFLDQLFGKKTESEQVNKWWRKLESEKDLETAVQKSFQSKVLIFKHSTRCFISKTVLKSFEKQIETLDKNYTFYFLDLLENRALSNEIETRFDVVHQSPQLIVLENGKATHNASHQSIDLEKV